MAGVGAVPVVVLDDDLSERSERDQALIKLTKSG